jgi:hypothetical protein
MPRHGACAGIPKLSEIGAGGFGVVVLTAQPNRKLQRQQHLGVGQEGNSMQDDQGDIIAAALDRPHVGGWSVGDTAFQDVDRGGIIHVVIGSNGENQIRAEDGDVSRGVAAGA